MVIYDFTAHYTHSNVLILERNESTIKKNRLRYEKELLLEKEKLKNTFLATLSHELRNPLSNILGLLTVLADEMDKKHSKTLGVVMKTGWYLESLLNDLLDISKISKGKLIIYPVPFRMRQIVKHLDGIYRSKREKGILKFEITVDPNIPRVLIGDPTRIKQILINLLDNAFKHTQTGKITLTISQDYSLSEKLNIKFEIKDTGIGIKDIETPKIFNEYYQIESFLNKTNGHGLGLKIVDDLVNLQHGTIQVNSIYGKGTTFTINIPYKNFTPPLIKAHKAKRGLYLNTKILLVDDSEIHQMILAKILLKELYFNIDFAINGEIALKMINEDKYDLLITDLDMPILNGYQLIKHVKNSKKNKDIPILVLSGKAMRNEKERVLKLGAKAFIAKPYKKEDLLKQIKAIVSLC